jgi:acyl-coenzyme A synthetase/AMP-(fatty) acid ligase
MLTARIFHWAEQAPRRAALTCDGRTYTYGDFARVIAHTRGFFARRGRRGPGVAAVATNNLMDFWAISLALRSLGLTTISLNGPGEIGGPRFPRLSLAAMGSVPDQAAIAADCERAGVPLDIVSLAGEAPLDLGSGPDCPIAGHILQTSGTTGDYKMVLMDPAFEAEFLARRRRINGINAESVVNVFNFHPRTGVGYKSPAGTWDAGGWVVFETAGVPYRSLSHPGLTLATVVPTMLHAFLALPESAYPYNPDLLLSVTGGTISQSTIDQAKARLTPRLYNGLGATESHMIALTPLDTPDDHRWHVPATGTRVEIVDDEDRPVAVGETGHLRVGTEGGPQGYLDDADATKAFFRNGYFYTGDLAVRRGDGRIALQGRASDVINVGGHKLSPAPIEDRLRESLGVGGVCLLTMQDAAGEEQLFVLVECAAPVPTERLAAALKAEPLLAFTHAQARFVPSLPRNAMGKLMRKAARDLVAG